MSEGQSRAASVFQRLVSAGTRLLRVIEHNEGGASKGLAKFADQINALCDEVEKQLTEAGEAPLHREGYRGGTWVLLDYGCIVVHVFNDEARKFYSLEHLWADGEEVDLSALLPHAE